MALGKILVEYDFRLFKHTTHHQLEDFSWVAVLWKDVKKSREDLYGVNLYTPKETSVTLATMKREDQAEKLGNTVATMLPLLSTSENE